MLTEALEEYCEVDKVGAAADFARQAIVHDEGGFYLDLDFSIREWDIRLNKVFDFFGFKC